MCLVEIFTPLYTSRVIQGIAIDKSEATFINAIIWMSILSAARYDRLIFHYCNYIVVLPFKVKYSRMEHQDIYWLVCHYVVENSCIVFVIVNIMPVLL